MTRSTLFFEFYLISFHAKCQCFVTGMVIMAHVVLVSELSKVEYTFIFSRCLEELTMGNSSKSEKNKQVLHKLFFEVLFEKV